MFKVYLKSVDGLDGLDEHTTLFTRALFPLFFQFTRTDVRCNFRPLTFDDFTRLLVCADPFNAIRFNVLRLLAINQAIRFTYFVRFFKSVRLRRQPLNKAIIDKLKSGG